jgi:hypothetical protein
MAGGRPRVAIDWADFDRLAAVQCTLAEIAVHFEVSEDTIERAVKREQRMSFADYFRQKRKGGFVSLRRKQWELAMSGNATMLIWLGKQYLGQKDRHEQSGPDGGQVEISYGAGLTLEQLDREIAKLLPQIQRDAARVGEAPAAAAISR